MEEKLIIYPLPKNPYPVGRMGKRGMQDWMQGIFDAALLHFERSGSKILVLTAFQLKDWEPEGKIYVDALRQLDVNDDDIIVIKQGLETIEEVAIAMEFAKDRGEELVIISTFLHYPRVRWLCRGQKGVRHKVAWGLPGFQDAIADIVLTFTFPIIDMLGMRAWFLAKVRARRERGTF